MRLVRAAWFQMEMLSFSDTAVCASVLLVAVEVEVVS
jgi:hypothetical protein